MKRALAFVAMIMSIALLATATFAAETMKGTIKKVDEKAGKITFMKEGTKKDEVLTVDKSVDLKTVKARSTAEITVDGGVVKEIKAEEKAKSPGY